MKGVNKQKSPEHSKEKLEKNIKGGGEKMLKSKKAQSTLEYIVVFTIVVAVIFVVAHNALRPAIVNLIDAAAGKVSNAATQFNQ